MISYWLPVCSQPCALRPASVEESRPCAAKAPMAMESAALSAATTIQPLAAAAAIELLFPGRGPAAGRHAAVDDHFLARHVAGGIAAQEQHAIGDVLRF